MEPISSGSSAGCSPTCCWCSRGVPRHAAGEPQRVRPTAAGVRDHVDVDLVDDHDAAADDDHDDPPRGRQRVCLLPGGTTRRSLRADSPEKDAQLADLQAQTEARLAENGLLDRKAGIVLTFGVAPTAGPGKATADAYNKAFGYPQCSTAPYGGVTANREFWMVPVARKQTDPSP